MLRTIGIKSNLKSLLRRRGIIWLKIVKVILMKLTKAGLRRMLRFKTLLLT